MMRTTLSIDDNLLSSLKEIAHRSGRPLKTVVNEALQLGLHELEYPKAVPYQLKASAMGSVRPGIDLDKVGEIADGLEDAAISMKLEMRK